MMCLVWQLLLATRYECKMVLRSWPFRIVTFLCFALASLQVVGTVTAIYFTGADRYLGPLLTASNTTMIGLTQMGGLLTWVVVFFANDLGGRDRRVGIADVVASQPMPAGLYVTARLLSLLLPLAGLMAAVLAVGLVANRAFGLNTAPFRQYAPFYLYFCLLGVAFTLSLTTFFSVLLRNRLLATLAALAPIIASVAWLNRYSSLFDIGGYTLGGAYSHLIGFGPMTDIFFHRGLYLCYTLLLLAGTVLLYPRPEAARGRRRVAAVLFVVLLLASAGLTYAYVLREQQAAATWRAGRQAMAEAAENTAAAVDHYDMALSLLPADGRLEAQVTTQIRNRDTAPQASFIFTLNPGLALTSVTAHDGTPVHVDRQQSVVALRLEEPLMPGETTELTWRYAGGVDPKAAWFNTPPLAETWAGDEAHLAKSLGEMSGWIGARFCYLLPESDWYPVPNVPYGHEYPAKRPGNFATARIAVDMPANWRAVTQGEAHADRDQTIFEVRVPVPQFSLCAGVYERVGAEIGGVDCALYYAPEHGGNVEFFADAAEELQEAIKRILEDVEDKLGIPYPYPSLSLVEVPSQCRTFGDGWDGRNLLVQPGVMLLRESDFFPVYFAHTFANTDTATREQGAGTTSAQVKAELLRRYFAANAFGGDLEVNLIKNYWEFQLDPTGTAHPALGSAFGANLAQRAVERAPIGRDLAEGRLDSPQGPMQDPFSEVGSDQEELLMPLGALRPEDQEDRFHWLMQRKTDGLLGTIALALGEEAWEAFTPEVLEAFQFGPVTLDDVEDMVAARTGEDVSWVFDQFVSEAVMPGYEITHAEAYEIESPDQNRAFQMDVRIANREEGKGYAQLEITTADETGSDTVKERLFFASHEEKEVRRVLHAKPAAVRVRSACARNVHDPFETLYVPEERRAGAGVDATTEVSEADRPVVITVDDRDMGFRTVDLNEDKRVRLVQPRREGEPVVYPEYSGFGAPQRWHQEITESAHGLYLRTRKVKRSGDGTKFAEWSAQLPSDGAYEVLVYTENAPRGRYRYTLENGASSQEVELSLASAVRGWNSLGVHRFKRGAPARVKLSDEVPDGGGGARVFADAVRWVYLDDRKD